MKWFLLKITNMSLARKTLYILMFWTSSLSASTPDGLCLVIGNGSIGQAFIEGNYLYSAANVFEKGIVKLFCAQSGTFVDVTSSVSNQYEIHSRYHTRNRSGLENSLSDPFDFGRVQINQELLSQFKLDRFSSVGEKVKNDAIRGIEDLAIQRAVVQFNKSQIERTYPSVKSDLAITGVLTEDFADDIFPVSIESKNDMLWINSIDWDTKQTVMFLDNTLLTIPGYSGAPLYQQLEDGTLLVSGVAVRVEKDIAISPNIRPGLQTTYALTMGLNHLTPSRIGEATGQYCKSLLSSIARLKGRD